jgi:choline dehydrogenase-like flavoprotein
MPAYDARLLSADHTIQADAVVVGTGAGGAVAAAELAGAGLRVVMIEEGDYHTGKDFRGDPKEGIDLLYRDGGLTGTLGRPPIPVPLGRCVGGTTTINSGTCYRAPDSVLARWEREFGLEGATDLGEHYRPSRRTSPSSPSRRAYGPQTARGGGLRPPWLEGEPDPPERARLPRLRRLRLRLHLRRQDGDVGEQGAGSRRAGRRAVGARARRADPAARHARRRRGRAVGAGGAPH